jgi:hypothetical protein
LAALEELTGLEGRRQIAETEAQAAANQLRSCEDQRRQARRGWRKALRQMGIDAQLSPRQIGRLQTHRSELDDLERRLSSRREEHDARRRQLDALRQSADELAAEAGISLDGPAVADRIAALQLALEEQETIFNSRQQLRRRWRMLRRRQAKVSRRLTQARQLRRQLLTRHGVADDQELHELAEACRQRLALISERDELDRRILAAAAGKCTPQEITELLSAEQSDNLDRRRQQLLATVSAARDELKQLYQRHGECQQQLAVLAADRRLPAKQLELSAVDQRLIDAARRWIVLAVTGQVLHEVRTLYERERQPETLRQASVHLEQLTTGHYTRVWTPLDEDVLLVDDDAGRPLPVELLSRGTREQVFLSLRLALVATYARRGVRLPLVLDDVLVNFDAGRARAAAAVLRDFASAGHQVLLFTCHEHIMKLFKSLKVPIVRLPVHAAAAAVDVDEEAAPEAIEKIPSQQRIEVPVATTEEEESEVEDDDFVDEYDDGESDEDEYEEEDEEDDEDEVEADDEYEAYELEEFTEADADEDEAEEEDWEDEADDEAEDIADDEEDEEDEEEDDQFDVDESEPEFDDEDEAAEHEQHVDSVDPDLRFTWEDRTHLEETVAEDDQHPDAEAA